MTTKKQQGIRKEEKEQAENEEAKEKSKKTKWEMAVETRSEHAKTS
jgi:hypothetical protein